MAPTHHDADAAKPENDRVPPQLRCEWGQCTNEGVTTRPGYHRPMKVCEEHTEDPEEAY